MDIFKIVCLVLFILLCIPVYIFGNRNELRIKRKKEILESDKKLGLDKDKILAIVKSDEYPFVFMISIPVFCIMIILYFILNKLEVTNFLIITLVSIIVVSELIFLTIRLISNRHYRNVLKDNYEVNTYELKDKKVDKKKLYLVTDEKEYQVKREVYESLDKGDEVLIIQINKHHIILPANIFYYLH